MTAHIWDAPTHTCEHEGCFEESVIDCHEPGDDETIVWLCAEHAREAGFCYLCGSFEAGHESFDFSPVPGVCAECCAEMEADYEVDDYADLESEYEPREFEDEPY